MKSNTYIGSNCIFIDSNNKEYIGLLNSSFGFNVKNSVNIFDNIDVLYSCMMFGGDGSIVDSLIDKSNLKRIKGIVSKNKNKVCSDWEYKKVDVMRWVLKGKLICNYLKFGEMLLKSGNKEIVIVNRFDNFWGVKDDGNGSYEGDNILGKLLMELRDVIIDKNRRNELKVWEVNVNLRLKMYGEWVENVYLEDKIWELGNRSFDFLIEKLKIKASVGKSFSPLSYISDVSSESMALAA
jgi:ribA/ribD-fused uncharacterized protein